MLKDFKAFIMKGNVLDLAVAVIIGAAFGAIVTSMVNDIIMPPIGLLLKGVDFKDLFVALNGQSYATPGPEPGKPSKNRPEEMPKNYLSGSRPRYRSFQTAGQEPKKWRDPDAYYRSKKTRLFGSHQTATH